MKTKKELLKAKEWLIWDAEYEGALSSCQVEKELSNVNQLLKKFK